MRKVPVVAAALMVLVCHPVALAETKNEPISLAAFSDGIKHWQDRHGTDYARYQPQQITEIADNLLLYQRDNGAWIENRDPARILDATEKAALVAEKAKAAAASTIETSTPRSSISRRRLNRPAGPPIARRLREDSTMRSRNKSRAAAGGRTRFPARRVITATSRLPTK